MVIDQAFYIHSSASFCEFDSNIEMWIFKSTTTPKKWAFLFTMLHSPLVWFNKQTRRMRRWGCAELFANIWSKRYTRYIWFGNAICYMSEIWAVNGNNLPSAQMWTIVLRTRSCHTSLWQFSAMDPWPEYYRPHLRQPTPLVRAIDRIVCPFRKKMTITGMLLFSQLNVKCWMPISDFRCHSHIIIWLSGK